ncbi:MAG: SpoIIE family protein phosphatase [Clostridia bacterium]|nr:SpoIIE family protein phosphatase [Clostridia bacterium]
MFQNIDKNYEENNINYEEEKVSKKQKIKEVIQKNFTIPKIILYIVCFMISQVSFGMDEQLAPFGVAILVAILSNSVPIGIPFIIIAVGNLISFGVGSTLNYVLITLALLFSILIKPAKYDAENNETRRLGMRVFITCLAVKLIGIMFKEFMVYDMLLAVMYSICTLIFYKIFVNAIPVITKLGSRKVYSVEEVMGTSLMLAIAVTCIGNFNIFGYSVKNILCILIVLVMGWKNGILVGATAGICVGTVLGVIGAGNVNQVASYALSGMVAGIFAKFGKIGVIIGFIAGNIALTYVTNGNTAQVINIQEILISAIGLLAVPKNIKINIEDMNRDIKLLPEVTGRNLEENKDTIYKLEAMSQTISEIAKSYKEAAATILDEEELKSQEKDNFQIFEKELQSNLEQIEENILFEDIYSPKDNIVEEIFDELLEKEMLVEKDLIDICARHNSYIMINENIKEDLSKMVKTINYSYRVSKLNFIWKKKLDENKKAVSNQLEEVSKAIESLAGNIETKPNQDEYEEKKQEIVNKLKEIEIDVKEIIITSEKTGRIEVKLYTNVCQNVEKPTCNIKKMTKIIEKALEEEMMLQNQECGLRLNTSNCVYTFISKDKQTIEIGIAKTTKSGSISSGDSNVQTRLQDGKYLVAISDGMGSGKEAKKSSNMAIAMLNKLLSSGFEKDTSLRLINSVLSNINEEDMYATLDIAIFDLYAKNLEFIKNGACPTFVKNKKSVQILKSLSLPTGILNDIDLVVYDKDLIEGDILVMCSDGILESSQEYTNKELWLKFLLEDIEIEDPQKIADIILGEAIDNNYGIPKDDMTVIVAKIKK